MDADAIAKLKELAALKESGILTEEEFSQQKAVILSGGGKPEFTGAQLIAMAEFSYARRIEKGQNRGRGRLQAAGEQAVARYSSTPALEKCFEAGLTAEQLIAAAEGGKARREEKAMLRGRKQQAKEAVHAERARAASAAAAERDRQAGAGRDHRSQDRRGVRGDPSLACACASQRSRRGPPLRKAREAVSRSPRASSEREGPERTAHPGAMPT